MRNRHGATAAELPKMDIGVAERCRSTAVAFAFRIALLALAISAPGAVTPAIAQSLEESGWVLAFEETGIEVYRRLMQDSEVVETLTKTTLAASPAQVFAVLTDYQHYPDTMPHIVETRVISSDGNVQQIYQRLRISEVLRFMIKDRYHVVDNRVTYPQAGDDHYRIEWSINRSATLALHPDDAIATRINSGYWDLQGIDGGARTRIRYYLHADPGGSIPRTFVNLGTTQSIPEVIRAIRDRLNLAAP